MFYKNNLLILLIISMFTFFEKADAKYEKLFFDHSIKNINNVITVLNCADLSSTLCISRSRLSILGACSSWFV